MIVTEIYVQDCKMYMRGEIPKTIFNTTYGSNYTIEADIIKTRNQPTNSSGIIHIGTSNAYLGVGFGASYNTSFIMFERRQGSEINQHQTIDGLPLNQWIHFKVSINGTSATLTLNNNYYTLNNIQVDLTTLYQVGNNGGTIFKDLKIY